MKVVVLTGYAGFIGSQLLRDLMSKNYFVIGLDNYSEGSDIYNYSEYLNNSKCELLYQDLSEANLSDNLNAVLRKLSIDVDYVINCAADSHVDRSWSQINKFIDSNIKGSINLANWALSQPKLIKFVQVSTDEVWGGAAQPFTEESIFSPENIYSTSKAAAEMFLENFKKAYYLPLVVTNGANTYGPRQMAEKIIPKTITSILKKEKVPLYRTPARRMWLHVEDHSEGIILAMEKGVVGEKYCLSPNPDQELYTHELVKHLCLELGVEFDEVVITVPDRLNYDLRYYMANTKAKKELGFNPNHHILDELPALVAWFKNKIGYK